MSAPALILALAMMAADPSAAPARRRASHFQLVRPPKTTPSPPGASAR